MPTTERAMLNMFNTITKKIRYGTEEYRQAHVPGGHKDYDILFFARDNRTREVLNYSIHEINCDLADVLEAVIYEHILSMYYTNLRKDGESKEDAETLSRELLNSLSDQEINELYAWYINGIIRAKERRFKEVPIDDTDQHDF